MKCHGRNLSDFTEEAIVDPTTWPRQLPALDSPAPASASNKGAKTLLFRYTDSTLYYVPRHVFDAVPEPIRWAKHMREVSEIYGEGENENFEPGIPYPFRPWLVRDIAAGGITERNFATDAPGEAMKGVYYKA